MEEKFKYNTIEEAIAAIKAAMPDEFPPEEAQSTDEQAPTNDENGSDAEQAGTIVPDTEAKND